MSDFMTLNQNFILTGKIISFYFLMFLYPQHIEERAKVLEEAVNCFHRCKNDFAVKVRMVL